MYVIMVYDIGVKRIDAIRITAKQYLNWIQNSVFEGEISIADLKELESRISYQIDPSVDSVLFFCINNKKWVYKKIIGVDKNNTSNII